MMSRISIEFKMILGAIFFMLLLAGFERYQLSENVFQQFTESKKSKNKLLVETISPIIGLNISLGLDDANTEYLNQIIKQNKDILKFELFDGDGKTLFHYSKSSKIITPDKIDGIHHTRQSILDPVTGDTVGVVYLHFDNEDYRAMIRNNQETTFKIFGITLFILIIFVLYIKKEFKFLNRLSDNVLQYNPQTNNFPLQTSDRTDEVGIIHNAIISMVTKINTYATLLDEMNQSLAQKVEERTKELHEANLQLQELSLTDPLTMLPNRRHLENYLQNIWDLAQRQKKEVSIIMCDIDFFKHINDKHGHIVGDFVLKELANLFKFSLRRNTDFIARYGGEEFIIILFDTSLKDAEELSIKITNLLKAVDHFHYQDILLDPITVSFGISCTLPDETIQYIDLIKLSDTALYQAKEKGRNCFVSIGR